MNTEEKEMLQLRLEREAIKKNKGQCATYDYCRYCDSVSMLIHNSDTPCADAYLKRQEFMHGEVTQ